MLQTRHTIGMALGGGAARGIAHIGVLYGLEEAGITLDYLAGTSAGALMGAIYASGIGFQEFQGFVLNLKWTDLFRPCPTRSSLMSSKRLVKLLRKHCPVSRFEDLQVSFAAMVTDFETGESVAITKGELFPALQASCSIPILFPPVCLNGRYYMDGGIAAELPVHAVRAMGADIVLACDVHHNADMLSKPGHFINMGMHLGRLIAKHNADAVRQYADMVIDVDARGIRLTDLHKAQELIQRGRRAAEVTLPELRKLIQNV